YAYARTVGETAETRAGAQHPVYLYDLGGAGDVVLTELAPSRGAMVFPSAAEGVYVVLDGSRRAVAEVAKARGDQRRPALAPGDSGAILRDDGRRIALARLRGRRGLDAIARRAGRVPLSVSHVPESLGAARPELLHHHARGDHGAQLAIRQPLVGGRARPRQLP